MEKFLNTADSEWFKQRLAGVVFLVIAGFSILTFRLIYLQVLQGEEFRRLSENNCIRLQTLDPPRGLIFDRNGTLLVDNRPSFDLSIVLKDANPLETTINKLSNYTGIPVLNIKDTIERNKTVFSYRPILLKKDIGRNLLASIEVHKFDLPGIVIDVRPRRHYIKGKSAAHLLGYLGEINTHELKSNRCPDCKSGDLIGKFGVEKSYDRFLRGKSGGRQVEVNASGQIMRVIKTVDAQPGHNVYLTIDQDVQERAEELLGLNAGAAVAMEPATGKIIALASSPSFDQNNFVRGLSKLEWNDLISNPLRPMENKAIQAEYPPASTFKIITAIAGLEEGVIDRHSTLFCPGYYQFGDRKFKCWKKGGHGRMDVVKALAQSCDVFFYQVGLKLNVDRLAWYAKAFGLGSATGIDLDHEARGLIPTAAWKKQRTGIPWQRGETLSVAIGQGYDLVTPIQLVNVISSAANGGTLYRPMILDKIETANGKLITKSQKKGKGKIPVSEKTLSIVKKGLWEVVNGPRGTARIARLNGVDICGKTGTAQVIGRKKNESFKEIESEHHLKSHAWFVAYAPCESPKIATAIMVEHGEHGSSAAAPIARELIRIFLVKTGDLETEPAPEIEKSE